MVCFEKRWVQKIGLWNDKTENIGPQKMCFPSITWKVSSKWECPLFVVKLESWGGDDGKCLINGLLFFTNRITAVRKGGNHLGWKPGICHQNIEGWNMARQNKCSRLKSGQVTTGLLACSSQHLSYTRKKRWFFFTQWKVNEDTTKLQFSRSRAESAVVRKAASFWMGYSDESPGFLPIVCLFCRILDTSDAPEAPIYLMYFYTYACPHV